MKKSYYRILIAIVFSFSLIFLVSGCGNVGFKESFTGTWSASQNTLKGNIYTGDITLKVKDDGSFQITDELGKISMVGKLVIKDKTTIELNCNQDGFIPPIFWSASKSDSYTYDFITADSVVISYKGNTIAFYRGVNNITADALKNDNWLTNNGIDNTEITYRAEITDTEINIYILDGEKIVRILNGKNLIYDSKKNQISFVPDTSVGFEPPSVWYSQMGNKIQEIVLDVEQKDNYMTLSYKGIPIKFYSDLMYQMDSNTNIYKLFDSSWVYKTATHTYEITFALGDTVFANCVDELGNEYFNGATLIDEIKNKMDFYVDAKTQTTELWGGLATEMSMDFSLAGNKLLLTYNGQTIEFDSK